MYQFSKPQLAVAIACVCSASGVWAQSTNSNSSNDDLTDVVTVASRYEQSLNEVLGDVTVISQEEIQRSGVTNITDLLKRVPGLQSTNNGGAQQTTSFFIRGSESKHTLFLIDGMRVGPLSGFSQFQIEHVPVDQIERIEILRGPGSALYGSDAVGGVIQIITKSPQQGTSGDLSVAYGSHNTKKTEVSANLGGETTTARLGLSYEDSNGFRATQTLGKDDAYRVSHGNFALEHKLSADTNVKLLALVDDVYNEYDNGVNKDVQSVYAIEGKHRWGNGATSKLRLGTTYDESDFPGAFAYETKSYQDQVAFDHQMPLAGGMLLAGYEYLGQKFKASSFGPNVDNSTVNSVLLGYVGQLSRVAYQVNMRYDDNSNYKNATTGHINLSVPVAKSWETGVGFGTGFKRPTFSQISGSPSFATPDPNVVNTALTPEESQTAELFLAYQQGVDRVRFTAYTTAVKDQITGKTISAGNTRFSNDPGESDIKGLTVDAATRYASVDLGGSLDYLSAHDGTGAESLRRARRTLKLFASKDFGKWTTGAEMLAYSTRKDLDFSTFPGTPVTLGGYGVVNATAQYHFDASNLVKLRVDNIFRKHYEVARGYNVPLGDALVTYQHKF